MSAQPRYRRIAELGRGGMAIVYLAAMRAGHGVTKLAVIKELHPELASDPEFRAMFLDEARLAARLNHPNVVQTYDVLEQEGGGCAIVMEYLEGQPLSRLRRWLASTEELLATHLQIHCEMLAGLEYAHHLADFNGAPLNIVHRDISPHNTFLTYSGEVKIVDFGIAKATSSSAETRMGTIKGKIAYMPPEQAKGEPVDARTDIFAVGVMLWEAAVGQRIWRGLSDVAIMHKLTTGEIPRPRAVKPSVDEKLEAIILRALAPSANDRYASAAEMQKELEVVIRTLPVPPRSRRELGEILTTQFAQERARMQREIEERLRQLTLDATNTGSFGPQSRLQPIPMPPESSLEHPALAGEEVRDGTSANAARSILPASDRTKRNLRLFVISSAASLALLVLVILVVGFAGSSKPTATAEAPSQLSPVGPATAARPESVPASTAASAPKNVRVALKVSPPSALVLFDGERRAGEVEGLEGSRHTIHAEAPGYEPLDQDVTLTAHAPVEIALTKRPAFVGATPTHHRPPPPPASTAKPPPNGSIDLGY